MISITCMTPGREYPRVGSILGREYRGREYRTPHDVVVTLVEVRLPERGLRTIFLGRPPVLVPLCVAPQLPEPQKREEREGQERKERWAKQASCFAPWTLGGVLLAWLRRGHLGPESRWP